MICNTHVSNHTTSVVPIIVTIVVIEYYYVMLLTYSTGQSKRIEVNCPLGKQVIGPNDEPTKHSTMHVVNTGTVALDVQLNTRSNPSVGAAGTVQVTAR